MGGEEKRKKIWPILWSGRYNPSIPFLPLPSDLIPSPLSHLLFSPFAGNRLSSKLQPSLPLPNTAAKCHSATQLRHSATARRSECCRDYRNLGWHRLIRLVSYENISCCCCFRYGRRSVVAAAAAVAVTASAIVVVGGDGTVVTCCFLVIIVW